ncbi:UNVERIFIED_CONTAM: rhoptry kinase family protein ROP19A, putative [Hammondia hammondi]|eukprot:XP_008885056.1 rhoptry kinase family protein ROP19A, putative [Hammondia hammondi]
MAQSWLRRLFRGTVGSGRCLSNLPLWSTRGSRRRLKEEDEKRRQDVDPDEPAERSHGGSVSDILSIQFDEQEGWDELADVATEADAGVFTMSSTSRQVIVSLQFQLPRQFVFECHPWIPGSLRPSRWWLQRGEVLGLGEKSVYFELGPVGTCEYPYAAKVFLISSNVLDLDKAFNDPNYADRAKVLIDRELGRRLKREFNIRRLTANDDPLSLLAKQGLLVPLCWGYVTSISAEMLRVSPSLISTRFFVIYPRMACTLEELAFHPLGISAKLVLTEQCLNLVTKFHGSGCIHRNLSLDSFMLDFKGHIYLRNTRRAGRYTGKPEEFVVPEDPLYLDPDTAISMVRHPAGKVISTHSRDSWALGITLFVLWFGRLPYSMSEFERGDPERKVVEICRDQTMNH